MKWISVKDRFPEKEGVYLVWCEATHGGLYALDEILIVGNKKRWKTVTLIATHWMPLPEPPE